jgi:signal transduction histidine kinase
MPLADLVHPQDRLATEDAISWQYESGEPLAGFANRLQCADGSAVWLEWTSKRVPDGMIFAVARDVTAKRKADAALAKAMDDLRIRNRELQDFAYVASHDLQEPLRKIQAFSDRLQSRLAANLDDSSRDYLKRMGDAASRMQTLIDDLLAYSRVGTRAAAPVEVDLARELATVLDDLDARVQEAGAVVEAEALPSLQADASQMRQLLQNLLANALKFRAHDRPCRIRISACPLGEPGTVVERWQLSVGTTASASTRRMPNASSRRSSGCIRAMSMAARVSDWLSSGVSLSVTVEPSGRKGAAGKAPGSS